jgi:FkbM family methyltransferase
MDNNYVVKLPDNMDNNYGARLIDIINRGKIEMNKKLKIQDIQIINIDSIHNYFYNEFKFSQKKKYIHDISEKLFSQNEIKTDLVDNIVIRHNYLQDTEEFINTENFNFVILKNDTCIADCLRTNVLFEKFLLSVMSVFLPKNKNMIDIGANIGIWSVVFRKLLQQHNIIYAFEPQPQIFDCLQKNIILNDINNVQIYNFALSNENTKTFMNASYDISNNFGAFRIVNNFNMEESLLEIECKIGDDITFNDIGFVKIDVEGHEYEVLQGLRNTITNNMPFIFIEIHGDQPNCNETLQILCEYGYKYIIKFTHCDYFVIP